MTTNNNVSAMGFYEKLGWRRTAVYRGAVDEARAMKPEIPMTDTEGVSIIDEIEYELLVENER